MRDQEGSLDMLERLAELSCNGVFSGRALAKGLRQVKMKNFGAIESGGRVAAETLASYSALGILGYVTLDGMLSGNGIKLTSTGLRAYQTLERDGVYADNDEIVRPPERTVVPDVSRDANDLITDGSDIPF